ncbi:tubulin glycylase 3A isoform X2 [Fopius arisanus]|uniref:Tubulin glycylase 3A isoform X2 n=1 Tax=Fopius arisanus TaxID=64838 RepID=A0A9R1TDA3_9HYME|nr:PREDICTED: tubulin glycylase 3A-like isoform X2 [Fopius arisanus]
MSGQDDDEDVQTGESCRMEKTKENGFCKIEGLRENNNNEEISGGLLSIRGSAPTMAFPATLQERFLHIKQIVKEAIESHHTFMIYGRAKVVRECMLKRGWIEKLCRRSSNGDRVRYLPERKTKRSRNWKFTVDSQQQGQQIQQLSSQGGQQHAQGHVGVDTSPVVLLSGIGDLRDEQSQRLLMSKMLANHTVDFLWNSGSEWPGWPSQDNKTTIFNRYSRAGFTSKVGLCANLRQVHWYYEPGVANTLFPRCYNVCQADHMHAFIEDFRHTACLSILKWFVEKMNNEGENLSVSSGGTVPLKALDFAIRRCSDYIEAQSHEDIDKECERVWSHQWEQFITWYYKIVHEEETFFGTNVSVHYLQASKHILKRIRKHWHQLDMDGVSNVWILKPGNKSRGRGIVLINKIEDVVARVNPANKSDTRYVVQKYIERPLLIHNTKFDIRQWFIVTCAQPLTLWMYRESYLRFCSQEFRLSDLHESVHLSNHAVQCKYKNSPDRNSALPPDNMWDATTFKHFLRSQGHNTAWDELIYPGMKQGLVGALLASQEAMDRRKNSFELYGADFMVMEDFSVWLIEINSQPDMSYSSSVTSRLCKQVMEDIVKVTVDFREDKNADTGLFDLVYKQKMPNCQPYLGAALSVQGTKINSNERRMTHLDPRVLPKFPLSCLTSRKKSTASSYIGPVIVDLIEELEIQLDRELHSYCKLDSPVDSNNSSPIISSPVLSSSRASLALIQGKIEATPPGSIIPSSSGGISPTAKSPTQIAQTIPKSSRSTNSTMRTSSRLKKITKETSAGQTVPSRISRSQREAKTAIETRSNKSDRTKIQNEEKLIGVAMRNAANKYKKYGTAPVEVPALPSFLVPTKTGKRMIRSSSVSTKTRITSSRIKRQEGIPDMAEMYAVGLGLTK